MATSPLFLLRVPSLFFTSVLLFTSAVRGADGDWPMWRRDPRLSGYQPLPGAMTQTPRVLAKYFVGTVLGVTTPAELRGAGSHDVLVVARSRVMAYDGTGKLLWESNPPGYVITKVAWVDDLDGDGRKEVVVLAGHMGGIKQAYLILEGFSGQLRAVIEFNTGTQGWDSRLGAFVPGERGKQIFLVTSHLGSYPKLQVPDNGEFALWSFDGKKTHRRWAWSPPEYWVIFPESGGLVIGDLAGDDSRRVVINSQCHVWNMDAATGKLISYTRWLPQGGANERHYGFSRLIDVDGDGKLDYVNLAHTRHVDVLHNVDGKFQLAWSHGWSDSVTTSMRQLLWPDEPVMDIDGDGKLEIVAALFDGQSDKRWHLYIWDAATGKVKAEALDLVPRACAPLWGKGGGHALLCDRSSDINYQAAKQSEVWRLSDGKLVKAWESDTAAFAPLRAGWAHDVSNVSERTTQGVKVSGADGDGLPKFFTTPRGAVGPLQAWGAGPHGAVVAKPGIPLSPRAARLPRLPQLEGTRVPFLLAADLDGDGRNELLLYDLGNVTVLRMEKGTLHEVERFPSMEIPIVCDLLGDGKPYVLTGGREKDGNLWAQARGPDRKVLWRFIFPQSAGSGLANPYNGQPHFFTIGHFTGGKHFDVFTYCSYPGARSYVLDGRTGKPVWKRTDVPGIDRRFQPSGGRATAWDYNGDGADDVLFCCADYYGVANGKTGELLVGPILLQSLVGLWAAYATPMVLPKASAEPVVYLGSAWAACTSISLDGKRCLWRESLPMERWRLLPTEQWRRWGTSAAFLEGLLPPRKEPGKGPGGDGWRVSHVEPDGIMRCFAARTGVARWQLRLPTATNGMITGDVDGDGHAKFIIGSEDGILRVVRDGGKQGEMVWSKQFDGPLGEPVMADLDGDGKCELVVSCGDGYVYVLGK